MESSSGSAILPPIFPNNFNYPAAELFHGTGQLSWLSPKAGLITSVNPSNKSTPITVSFQLKDFCDIGVSDLTSVLRVGFRLAFNATSATDSNDYIASYVSPISDTDLNSGVFNDTKELDLEIIEQNLGNGVRQAQKDSYILETELQSIYFLLSIFHKSNVHFISLSSLHSRISNSGKDELYRYIGSSSLKRRQFIERRSYVFHIAENDSVFLQPPEIYTTVCLLAGFLLSHGGVTSSDTLFTFFCNNNLIPSPIKDSIKSNRSNFIDFLSRHPFAFSPFPSQFYVSVRRNIPYFDYNSFIKKNFPTCALLRTQSSVSNFSGHRQYNNFDGNENTTNIPSVAPIFQEDPFLIAQKTASRSNAGNSTAWSNDIGFFEHKTNNNITMHTMNPGKVPIGSTAIVGRGSGSSNGVCTFSNDPSKVDFSKIDVSRCQAELAFRNSNSPVMQMRKVVVNNSTQTDTNFESFIGFNNNCKCKCTCQESQKIVPNHSSEILQHNGNNNFLIPNIGVASDFMAQNIVQRQRPVSVQEQPINIQRPLFSALIGNEINSGSESTSSTNLFNTASIKPLNEFNPLSDSFFNQTLNSISFSFMPSTTTSSMNNGFLNSDFNAIDSPLISSDSAISSAASSSGSFATVAAIGRQGLPLPIGNGSNVNGSKNFNKECSTSNSNFNSPSVNSLQERLYDPFGKSMPFELKLSSLKL